MYMLFISIIHLLISASAPNHRELPMEEALTLNITWPLDFMITVENVPSWQTAIHPSNLVPPFNRPIVTDACTQAPDVEWEDDEFIFEELTCVKVLRTWTVTSCEGFGTHVQIIKVILLSGPILPCNAP